MNRDPLSFRHTARCVSEPLHVRLQQWVALRLVPTLLTALLFAALMALLEEFPDNRTVAERLEALNP